MQMCSSPFSAVATQLKFANAVLPLRATAWLPPVASALLPVERRRLRGAVREAGAGATEDERLASSARAHVRQGSPGHNRHQRRRNRDHARQQKQTSHNATSSSCLGDPRRVAPFFLLCAPYSGARRPKGIHRRPWRRRVCGSASSMPSGNQYERTSSGEPTSAPTSPGAAPNGSGANTPRSRRPARPAPPSSAPRWGVAPRSAGTVGGPPRVPPVAPSRDSCGFSRA